MAEDFPFDEIAQAVQEHIDNGCLVFQKFSCAKCGNRLIIEIPNRLYTTGSCDKCGHVTDIQKQGCNYLLMAGGVMKPVR